MTCKIQGCARKVVARECCGPHYYRLMTYGNPTAGPDIRKTSARSAGGKCAVEGCSRPVHSHPYCKAHAQRLRRTGDPGPPFPPAVSWAGRETCRVEGCEKKAYVKSEQLCAAHYTRLHKYGDVHAYKQRRQAEQCIVDGCQASPSGTGGSLDMCKAHYAQSRGGADARIRTRRWILARYGLTQEDYEDLLRGQEYRCAICATSDPGFSRKGTRSVTWCVDHDHRTGQVRGLLCHPCNRGIGAFSDSPDIVQAALSYLERRQTARTDLRLARKDQALLDAERGFEMLRDALQVMGAKTRKV